jgi:predicted RNA binding protein with dsRBD fold (UPF0201 family)
MSQPDFKARITLEATVSPSEDPWKVAQAVANVVAVDSEQVRVDPHKVRLATEDPKALVWLRDQFRDRHIRTAARRQLLLKSDGRRTSLMLNRQAAAAGVIVICGSPQESPLGPIYLTVEASRAETAIDWLTAYS